MSKFKPTTIFFRDAKTTTIRGVPPSRLFNSYFNWARSRSNQLSSSPSLLISRIWPPTEPTQTRPQATRAPWWAQQLPPLPLQRRPVVRCYIQHTTFPYPSTFASWPNRSILCVPVRWLRPQDSQAPMAPLAAQRSTSFLRPASSDPP